MKAIISCTNDDNYLFLLPIISFCWSKLGVDIICFGPKKMSKKQFFVSMNTGGRFIAFDCPPNKEITYAQCSRLFAAAIDELPEDELLITSDADMALFRLPKYIGDITIEGADLVPEKQFPMCYATAPKWLWKKIMNIGEKSVQECLDDLLGHIECENMRGNYWGKDQETLWNKAHPFAHLVNRARPETQFASNRVDRDDTNWRSYLGPDLFDAHLWRPGYTDENFANIMELLQTQYPEENFDWVRAYRNEYIKLL
jgi:hypothetical protein